LFLVADPPAAEIPDSLQTVAERTGFKATSRYADVEALCRALAARSPNVHLGELGRTNEGRAIPLLVLANPPVRSAEEARRSGKLRILVIGNIHAGEVCGKEAILMLAREILERPEHPLLNDVVLALAPIYNADGNEQISKTNRLGQNGPEDGMGRRENAQGLDLNRDFIKLDAPESRALVKFFNEWDPHVFIDAHTTNGSYHRFPITYGGPRNPAGDPRVIRFMRKIFFPEVSTTLAEKTGIQSFYYGNFGAGKAEWTTYPAEARYGTNYVGLRNRLSILSEAYKYDPFNTRVMATLDFIKRCLEVSASHRGEIFELLAKADRDATLAGQDPKPADLVAIRSKAEPQQEPATILGYDEKAEREHRFTSDAFKKYKVRLLTNFVPVESVARPAAYLIPPREAEGIATLRRHGLTLLRLRRDTELDVESNRIESVDRSPRRYEGHHPVRVTVKAQSGTRMIPAGTIVVTTAQPLGSLAVYLLEPQSEDGLTTWDIFGERLKPGVDFPVLRLPRPTKLDLDAAD
jgi:hypothetical protein